MLAGIEAAPVPDVIVTNPEPNELPTTTGFPLESNANVLPARSACTGRIMLTFPPSSTAAASYCGAFRVRLFSSASC